jgi:vacuolar protein sorting-associated protein 35
VFAVVERARTIFAFVEATILKIGEVNKEVMVKLLLDAALAVDSCIQAGKEEDDYGPVVIAFLNQSCDSFENNSFDPEAQVRCIYAIAGALQKLGSVDGTIYESTTTKVAQFAARVIEKPQQCRLIAVCAHLFYPVNAGLLEKYNNAQRSLECLQRCLKLADACTSLNPSHVTLFVDLLEDYIVFFEAKNPLVTDGYITGLLALIKEHLNTTGMIETIPREAKVHFVELIEYIKDRKNDTTTSELFASVVTGE